ncbi:MAG TPA: HAMP domain-containing sensor histidine kinase [Nocardioidaceae bacterium]|nr:HAMP domain-containing sensor histidine kinase [Nocardioidaceae bacterium]
MISVIGLLLVTVVGGAVALTINDHVGDVAEGAIGYEVELEDTADDLRVAVLDVRHYHRNLLFSGPSRHGMAEYQGAYATLLQQIAALERLGVRQRTAPQPARLRVLAQTYFADFWPAVLDYDTDRTGFVRASDTGLVRLDRLSAVAQELDRLGEQLSAQAFTEVERDNRRASLILVAVLLGILLVAAVLAYTTARILRLLHDLYTAQQQVADDLSRSLQEKAEFIADVSHELRTPLTVLRGNAELALAADTETRSTELFADIAEEAARMSRLIDDLLMLARAESNTLRLQLHPTAAEPWLAELAGRAEMLARQNGAAYETSVDSDCNVRIDRERMEQAVLILVDNATTYAPPGEPVHLCAKLDQDQLLIEVRDHGPGIPADQLPLVFERFHRLDQTADLHKDGSGLGLAIARSIVAAHGGTIEAHSRPSSGTTMRIRLPIAE